jgi:hypothetical protein
MIWNSYRIFIIELVSYLNHSRNNFASLHVNYMFLHTLDLNRPFPLHLFIYLLSTTSLSIECFPNNIDSNASTRTIYHVFDHYQVIQCGQRNTKSSSERHFTQKKLTCLSISYMTFVMVGIHLFRVSDKYLQ